METKHTPTPWTKARVEFDFKTWSDLRHKNGLFETVGKGQDIIAITFDFDGVKDGANAVYIVRAVNAHQELLEAAKNAVEIFKTDGRYNGEVSAVARLRQAIAKAEDKL